VSWLAELDAWKAERLGGLVGDVALAAAAPGDARAQLHVALANEINVSELAAAWMPSTRELDVKLAFARQAGDEAGHFELVAGRLAALGVELASFAAPASPLFDYLRGLTGTVERIAAGLYALESIAYAVNEQFIASCDARGDAETVRIYREMIQPDELAHHELGRRLLERHAAAPDAQVLARATVGRVLELAAQTRAAAAARLGTRCFPGC